MSGLSDLLTQQTYLTYQTHQTGQFCGDTPLDFSVHNHQARLIFSANRPVRSRKAYGIAASGHEMFPIVRYGTGARGWTTEMFIDAVYRDLSRKK